MIVYDENERKDLTAVDESSTLYALPTSNINGDFILSSARVRIDLDVRDWVW